MNKTVIAGGIVVATIIVSIAYGASMNPGGGEKRADSEVWNMRFSGEQDWIENGYANDRYGNGGGCLSPDYPYFHFCQKIGLLREGTYMIDFVPMGDSPSAMKIMIGKGGSAAFTYEPYDRNCCIFEEHYILDRTLVDTGISKYYTWEYLGDKYLSIPKNGVWNIFIEPSSPIDGSVSVSISKVNRSI